ncbi:MAG: DUF4203 domain-containing protein [Phycisphaeraceae bacterium]
MLAQSTESALVNLFETVTRLFSRADALAQPELLVEHLQTLGVVWAVVFLILGLMCLLNGYKFYRVATISFALLLGSFAGYWLGQKLQAPAFVIAGCVGLLMAVLAFPLMKYAVAVFGGIVGAFLGANIWAGLAHALSQTGNSVLVPEAHWAGALLGLVVCGMLAFVLFELSVMLLTSVSGATIAVFGALALLLSFEPWQDTISRGLTGSQVVVPMLVIVPAAIGLVLQETWGRSAAAAGKKE